MNGVVMVSTLSPLEERHGSFNDFDRHKIFSLKSPSTTNSCVPRSLTSFTDGSCRQTARMMDPVDVPHRDAAKDCSNVNDTLCESCKLGASEQNPNIMDYVSGIGVTPECCEHCSIKSKKMFFESKSIAQSKPIERITSKKYLRLPGSTKPNSTKNQNVESICIINTKPITKGKRRPENCSTRSGDVSNSKHIAADNDLLSKCNTINLTESKHDDSNASTEPIKQSGSTDAEIKRASVTEPGTTQIPLPVVDIQISLESTNDTFTELETKDSNNELSETVDTCLADPEKECDSLSDPENDCDSLPDTDYKSVNKPNSLPILLLNNSLLDSRDFINFPRRNSVNRQGSDLEAVKAMTTRLNLSTRRPSYIEWKEKYLEKPDLQSSSALELNEEGNGWSPERKQRINDALDWLRQELLAMREDDQELARKLISLRREIHNLKLQRSYAQHKEILEEAMEIEEERDELAELSDVLPDQFSPTLKQFGVTRMNISTRRFSVF